MSEFIAADGATGSAQTALTMSAQCIPLRAPHDEMHSLIELLTRNAQSHGLVTSAADLGRIELASTRLRVMLDEVIGKAFADAPAGDDPLHAHPHLRHDLRTPINAIKGYGDMLLEDWQDAGAQSLMADLRRVLALSDQLLALIDSLPAGF